MLVLTGISTRHDLPSSPVLPTYVADDLRTLFTEG
jgi:ribonucleotide monophosphatase NagD (HAD superfamily)